jgi:hypothetical protein
MIKKIVQTITLILLLACNSLVKGQQQSLQQNSILELDNPEKSFLSPPESAKPGVLWMWMGSNLSKAGIKKDLEALKQQGFNRTTMFSLADITTPWATDFLNSPSPEIISWTEPWWDLVKYAAEQSKRLGMDFGMYNGPGYESSGGPWITPEHSMQEICWSKTNISGNSRIQLVLDKPKVALKGRSLWPIHNPATDKDEILEVAARATYYKDIVVMALPAKGIVPLDQVIDLTTKMKPDGSLDWDAPAGDWIIYRFGHTTSGTMIQPAQWKATGMEADKMSQAAMDFHLDHVIGEIKKHLGDLIGTGFTHVHFDSYEAGKPTWTPKMREEFLKRRGYDLTPYLATFAGRIVGNDKKDSLKIVQDFDATIKDLYSDIYFKTIAKKLNAAKLRFLCEPYGGPWRQDDIMPQIQSVMTEFWTTNGVYKPYQLDPTVVSLRKSGKNIVEAEAFTGNPNDSKWDETPAWLKPIGDAAFCAGVNRFVLHRFVQQPWDDKYKPAATMGQWGTHFDRTQTWWKPAKALVTYWQRCQALLQWGTIATPDPNDFRKTGSQDVTALKHIHRTGGQTHLFFVANTSHKALSTTCSFKVSGMQPELWDPVTGTMRDLNQFDQNTSQTTINLNFDDAQSFFIVFRKKIKENAGIKRNNFPTTKSLLTIDGPWLVKFDNKWGGPEKPLSFSTLDDWTKRPEPGIKYYSGTAVYTQLFDAPKISNNSALYLDLGIVKHIANVKINGVNIGVVWTAPWRIQIPQKLLKAKANSISIEVTNVWANRLIGDEQEPSDCQWVPGPRGNGFYLKEFPDWFIKGQPRPSKGRYCFTTWNYFKKDSPLISSGLMGPVRIIEENE